MYHVLLKEFDHFSLYDNMSSSCNVGVESKLFELMHEVEMQMTAMINYDKYKKKSAVFYI